MENQTLSTDELKAVIDGAIDGAGGIQPFAKAHGLSRQFVADVRHGRRGISPAIAAAMGYEKACVWRKKEN